MEGLNLVTQNDPKNPAAEAYRVIRTSVQFAQAGKELQTIALTSCTPNEGKSTTIANLAVVLTQAGKSVLLIDCDMRNPTVHKNFNLSKKSVFRAASAWAQQLPMLCRQLVSKASTH